MTNYHAPFEGDLFAPRATCGAEASTEPDGVLRMHQPGTEVTCTACRDTLLAERNWEPPHGWVDRS